MASYARFVEVRPVCGRIAALIGQQRLLGDDSVDQDKERVDRGVVLIQALVAISLHTSPLNGASAA